MRRGQVGKEVAKEVLAVANPVESSQPRVDFEPTVGVVEVEAVKLHDHGRLVEHDLELFDGHTVPHVNPRDGDRPDLLASGASAARRDPVEPLLLERQDRFALFRGLRCSNGRHPHDGEAHLTDPSVHEGGYVMTAGLAQKFPEVVRVSIAIRKVFNVFPEKCK